MSRSLSFRSLSLAAVVPVALLSLSSARAATLTITNDTYIDSYDPNGTTAPNDAASAGSDNAHTNYGGSMAVKAVTSPASGNYPYATSNVHTLFTLPAAYFSDPTVANGVSGGLIEFRSRNNMLNAAGDSRGVEIHPLLQSFTAGNSPPAVGTPTMGGSHNAFGSANGTDWYSTDGVYDASGNAVNPWSAVGAPFDTTKAGTILGTLRTSGGITYLDFQIWSLLDNPTTLAEIKAHGLLLNVTNEYSYPTPQDFISLYSSETGVATGPSFTYVVPEPASLGLLGGLTLLALRRREQA